MFASRRTLVVVALFVLVLSVACGGSIQPEPGVTPVVESTAVSAAPQIFVVPRETEKRLVNTEVIPQPNCDGTIETSDTVERSHSLLRTLELGSGITVSAEGRAGVPGIGEVAVGAAVASYYQVSYGTADTITRSVTVGAKEGTNVQYTLQHYEIWEKGELLIVAGPVSQQIPYSFRKDFSIEKLPPANIGCPGQDAPPQIPTEPTQTLTPPGTNTPAPPPPTSGPTVTAIAPTIDVAPIPTATSLGQAESTGACGPKAFDTLLTANPLFRRPEGMQSGYLTSDPATVQLADGTQMRFDTQFVLVVQDVSQVQVLGVGTKPTGEANTWGCWFLAADSRFAEEGARRDFQIKIDAGNRAVLYRLSSAGFEPLNP